MLTIRKRGKFWHARGTVPVRQADGKIAHERIEESTGETGEARARRAADRLWDYYNEQAYRPAAKASPSFTDAALTYVETKQPSKRDRSFVKKLVAHFGETPIAEIGQGAVSEAASRLYPEASASTQNRAVYAPVVTVMRLSGCRPDFKRPKIRRPPISVPPDDWFDDLLPACSPKLASLVVFLTLTGRRVSEALQAINNGDGTVTIGRTKTGNSVVLALPDICRRLIGGERPVLGSKVWTYGDRHNVYRELRAACKRAGVPYYGTHSLGRHAFATRLLKKGWSVKHVAAGGGWASPKMVLERYGHIERSEVAEAVTAVGDEWGKELLERQKKAGNGT